MIVLLDTDILIDLAISRQPFEQDAARVLDLSQQRLINAFIAWHSLSNFYYLISSPSGKETALDFIKDLLTFVNIAPTTTADARFSTRLNCPDFEDGLQMAAAHAVDAEWIITRNIKHYQNSPVPALPPGEFLSRFQ